MAQQITTIGGGSLPNNPASPLGFQGGGPEGAAWVQEISGKFYAMARAGRVFSASALVAGVTIPVNTATAMTFGIFNPAGSGINVELCRFAVGTVAAGGGRLCQLPATLS